MERMRHRIFAAVREFQHVVEENHPPHPTVRFHLRHGDSSHERMEIKCSQNLLATSSYAASSLANSMDIARRFKVYMAIQLVPFRLFNVAAGGQGEHCGRRLQCCRAPGIRPGRCSFRRRPLRLTHQVKLSKQLVKDALQKILGHPFRFFFLSILYTRHAAPGMNWRIHITECPFVRRELAIGVHIPLAKHQYQTALWQNRSPPAPSGMQ